jgi:hypothetical protein
MRYREIAEMQLDELMGVKKFATMNHSDVIEYINSTFGPGKFEEIGGGSNGVALARGDTVYKFWFKDSAYEDFVSYCEKNKSNPYLPKFKSGVKELPAFFVRSLEAPDRIRYIKMERLTVNRQAAIQVTEPPHAQIQGIEYLCDRMSSLLKGMSVDKLLDHYVKFFDDEEIDAPVKLTAEFKLLIKTMGDLFKITSNSGHIFDIHEGNFLVRGEQPVIIDPMANESDLGINYQISNFVEKMASNKLVPKKDASRRTRS